MTMKLVIAAKMVWSPYFTGQIDYVKFDVSTGDKNK